MFHTHLLEIHGEQYRYFRGVVDLTAQSFEHAPQSAWTPTFLQHAQLLRAIAAALPPREMNGSPYVTAVYHNLG